MARLNVGNGLDEYLSKLGNLEFSASVPFTTARTLWRMP